MKPESERNSNKSCDLKYDKIATNGTNCIRVLTVDDLFVSKGVHL